jgi:hypothetical protein
LKGESRPRRVAQRAGSAQWQGWRADKATSGCLIDVASGETVARGFAMPHSPRVHRGRVWMLHSGAGQLVLVDPASGRAETLPQRDMSGPAPKAKSIIQIYLQSGFAHMDSCDPKPDAPLEYRGILGTIETALPGIRFSSHMEHTAEGLKKFARQAGVTGSSPVSPTSEPFQPQRDGGRICSPCHVD